MRKLLLIDGNALMHRAFHALPPFKTSSGVSTNIVYGFFSVLHKSVTDYQPTHLAVCFDTPAKTFRNDLYDLYQAQRPKVDDDFISQIPLVKEAVQSAQILQMEKDGFEADDLIGTSARRFPDQVLILTGDKDIMQLVDQRTFVISPQIGYAKSQLFTKEEVWNKLHVFPEQIPDYKALAGDPSDNYPGAKGIGPKTAQNLIEEFHTVENLYEKIHQVKNKRMQTQLMESKKNVLLAKKLAVIVTDVSLPADPESGLFTWFHEDLNRSLLKLEMYSLSKRLFEKRKKTIARQPQIAEPDIKPQLELFS